MAKVTRTTYTSRRYGSRRGRRYSGKTGRSGVKSNYFASQSRNYDYKYKLVDNDDNNQPYQDESWMTGDAIFIPLSFTDNVSKSMKVTITSRQSFGYCVFQNTPQFKNILSNSVLTYLPSDEYFTQKYIDDTFKVTDLGTKSGSIYSLPVGGINGQNASDLSSSLFSRLVQAQSTYNIVDSSTNNGMFKKTVTVYNQKATQFLSGSNSVLPIVPYLRSQNQQLIPSLDPTEDQENNIPISWIFKTNTFSNMFYQNDMVLCIFNSSVTGQTHNTGDFYLSINIKRQVFQLVQDIGLTSLFDQSKQRVVEKKVEVLVPTPQLNAAQTQANQVQNQKLQNLNLFRPILRGEQDNLAANTNSITIDNTCYDSTVQELQAEGYMDLQAAPDDGTNLMVEPNTSGANSFTKIANRSTPQLIADANISNTGPSWIEYFLDESVPIPVKPNIQYEYRSRDDYSYEMVSTFRFLVSDGVVQNVPKKLWVRYVDQFTDDIYTSSPSPSEDDVFRLEITRDPAETLQMFSVRFYTYANEGTTISYFDMLKIQGYLKYIVIGVYGNQQSESPDTLVPNNYGSMIPYYNLSDMFTSMVTSSAVSASKAWAKIKGFFKKVGKFFKKVIPVAAKVVSQVLPGPIGTVASIIGDTITNVSTTLNATAVASQPATALQDPSQAVDYTGDKFIITPQYRVGLDIKSPVEDDPSWVSADPIEVEVNSTANSVQIPITHNIRNHPNYPLIQQWFQAQKAGLVGSGTSQPYAQQRIKFSFRKQGVTPQQAANYKTTLVLGSDTFYSDDQGNVE